MAPQLDPTLNGDSSAQGPWREWARHILIELERLNTVGEMLDRRIQENRSDIDTKLGQARTELQTTIAMMRENANKDVSELRIEIAMLKIRAGLWGALGAAVPILITLLIALIVHYITKGGTR